MFEVTIDSRMINASGIGTYLRNIVPLVIKNLPHVKFNILGNYEDFHEINWQERGNITMIHCESTIYSIDEQFELLKCIPRTTNIFWSPHYNIPICYRGKLIVTVHDVFHLAMPNFVNGIHRKLYAHLMFRFVRRQANAIICPSSFTKNELLRFLPKGQQSVNAIHNGVDESWFTIKNKLRVHSKPFFLYVGNVKPHKNLGNLILAFERIKDKVSHDLVIVGKKEGFITNDEVIMEKACILGERVTFTGHIQDDLLKQYFRQADALVFPSLYEGFGLPPLEAMACECPAIVAKTASLPEVCGDAVLYCDPYDPSNIAEQMLKVAMDKILVTSLKEKGLRQAKKFSWSNSASKTTKVFEEVLAQ